jgi:hypothetical protein
MYFWKEMSGKRGEFENVDTMGRKKIPLSGISDSCYVKIS